MRDVKYIVLHCTATPQTTTVESIQNYWRNDLGWKNPGYHYIIKSDGEIVNLLPIDKIANGVKGYNSVSIHIAYIGGVEKMHGKAIDNRTEAQKKSQIRLIRILNAKYPDAEIKGHRDFPKVNKDCPSFDVKTWLKTVGLACLILLMLVGCKTRKVYVPTPGKVIENTKIITEHDTTFVVEPDSSFYQAWIECRDGKPILKQPTHEPGKNQLKSPDVTLDSKGELNVSCIAENIELKAKIREIENKQSTIEYVPVEVERELTFYQKLLINLGKVFGVILIGAIGYGAVRVILKQYVRK